MLSAGFVSHERQPQPIVTTASAGKTTSREVQGKQNDDNMEKLHDFSSPRDAVNLHEPVARGDVILLTYKTLDENARDDDVTIITG